MSRSAARPPTRRLAPGLLGAAALAVFALPGCAGPDRSAHVAGNIDAGAEVLTQMACGSCHEIPGLPEANGKVGPSLADFGDQKIIAGKLPNTQANLERYLLDPQAAVPGNVMPAEHLTRRQARDAAAYLLALR